MHLALRYKVGHAHTHTTPYYTDLLGQSLTVTVVTSKFVVPPTPGNYAPCRAQKNDDVASVNLQFTGACPDQVPCATPQRQTDGHTSGRTDRAASDGDKRRCHVWQVQILDGLDIQLQVPPVKAPEAPDAGPAGLRKASGVRVRFALGDAEVKHRAKTKVYERAMAVVVVASQVNQVYAAL